MNNDLFGYLHFSSNKNTSENDKEDQYSSSQEEKNKLMHDTNFFNESSPIHRSSAILKRRNHKEGTNKSRSKFKATQEKVVNVNFDDSSINYSSLNHTMKGETKKNLYHPIMEKKDNANQETFFKRSRSESWADSLSNMSDFANPEEIILDAVDRIEDELDAQIPLPFRIRIFFEEYLFGWDHLTSDIIGSLFYPLAMSVMQYYIFTFLWMDHSLFEEIMTIIFDYLCMIIYKEKMVDFVGDSCWNFSVEWNHFVTNYAFAFKMIRFIYSLIVAIVTFRAIRRRRKVWFRTSYGSKAYYAEALQRRKEVHEVDKTTLLGRIRKNVKKRKNQLLASRVRRKLYKANTRFEKKASRTNLALMEQDYEAKKMGEKDTYHLRNIDDHFFVESVAHDQIYLPENIGKIPYAHGGYFGASPFMLADPIWVDILRTLMPNVYVEVAKRVFAPAPKLIHWGENNPVVAAYGTAQDLEWRDIKRVQDPITLEWDVFLDPNSVEKLQTALKEREKLLQKLHLHYYSPFDDKTKDILQRSCTYKNVEAFLIQVLELRDKEVRKRTKQVIESMLIAHGTLSQLILEQTGLYQNYVYARVKRARKTLGGGIFAHQWLAVYAEALKMGLDGRKYSNAPIPESNSASSESPSSPTTCSNSTDGNQIGDCDINDVINESNVDYQNLSSEDIFLAEIKEIPTERCESRLSKGLILNPPVPSHPVTPQKDHVQSTSLDALAKSVCPSFSIMESMEIINGILCNQVGFSSPSKFKLGLVLDLKSRRVPKQVWAMIVDMLRQSNIRVEGVSSFIPEELRGISTYTCKPVREVIFCHSAGDLQGLAHEGKIENGDTVYFNAGSLIWDKGPSNVSELFNICLDKVFGHFDANDRKSGYAIEGYAQCLSNSRGTNLSTKSTIQAYKGKFNLSIGLYCQEFAVDEAAIKHIIQFVNKNSHVYDLGLSWGGLNGITVANIQPGRFTSTDGLWNQRYAGRRWQTTLCPNDI